MITKIIKEYVEKYDNNITLELLLNDLFLNWNSIQRTIKKHKIIITFIMKKINFLAILFIFLF